ncbi:MAG: RNA methyltransferase [Patescibacteria group bacterium]|nr:RNA methyltransferase [Patescibacteria group bacterium]MCL5432255.1 RNA methyltransferase [Patescibacteria group bacterium]
MITSIHNPLIKEVRGLQQMRKRKQAGLTVLEGFRTLRHAAQNGWKIRTVLFVPEKINADDKKLLDQCRAAGARLEEITEPILEKLSRREGPLGAIAVIFWQEKYTLETLPLPKNPLILVAEAIEKPGNLGVLIRSASAAGADGVILCDALTAFHDPSCVHSSLGSVFTLPCVTTTTRECLAWLKAKNITSVVTTPAGKIAYTRQDFTRPTAIIMGNEHAGASQAFLDQGVTVQIPMHGPMDSLNVSVAGALFLFEAIRQRS